MRNVSASGKVDVRAVWVRSLAFFETGGNGGSTNNNSNKCQKLTRHFIGI